MDKFHEDNLDVLQSIEFAIIQEYRSDASLLDIDVGDAVIRHYRAEENGRTPPFSTRCGERAQRVFLSVQRVCEWRLGRAPAPGESEVTDPRLPISLLLECLREIRNSIRQWTERCGRKGYLDFVKDYVP